MTKEWLISYKGRRYARATARSLYRQWSDDYDAFALVRCHPSIWLAAHAARVRRLLDDPTSGPDREEECAVAIYSAVEVPAGTLTEKEREEIPTYRPTPVESRAGA
jgi:hypothetical protein